MKSLLTDKLGKALSQVEDLAVAFPFVRMTSADTERCRQVAVSEPETLAAVRAEESNWNWTSRTTMTVGNLATQTTFLLHFCRFGFEGEIFANGANNDNPLNSVKGAAGTIFIRHDVTEEDEEAPLVLWVHGDTTSDLEQQSYAVISGITPDDFVYDVVSLRGKATLQCSVSTLHTNAPYYPSRSQQVHLQRK